MSITGMNLVTLWQSVLQWSPIIVNYWGAKEFVHSKQNILYNIVCVAKLIIQCSIIGLGSEGMSEFVLSVFFIMRLHCS